MKSYLHRSTRISVSLLLLTLLLCRSCVSAQTTATAAKANICFIVFQMADNNLEYFIREDNLELIESKAIREPSLTTWVYHDGRNIKGGFLNDLFRNIREPLDMVYYRNGTALENGNFKGSIYMTYDHATSKMVVDRELSGEQNGDNPQTIEDFVTHALTDCVTNRNTTEYFVLLSSHGGGWGGFGGDDHPSARRRRRRLVQPNDKVATALSSALSNVNGAPTKYNVLAFDACLMSALDALDEYHTITDYYMASEATVPGHGWAYNYLENVDSAMSMAQDMYGDFLEQPQGKTHQTPKTLAIIDTKIFITFLAAWELLDADNADPYLLPILNRARQIAISFQGYSDSGKQQTAVDIGSFLATFNALCQPVESGDLYVLRNAAGDAYYDMLVAAGVGPGTQAATGVQLFWPTRRDFNALPELYTIALFDDPSFATQMAPNWLAFLKLFYTASESPATTGESVCVADPSSLTEPAEEGQLLLNPTSKEVGKGIMVQSEVTRNTDEVLVEFGLDLYVLRMTAAVTSSIDSFAFM